MKLSLCLVASLLGLAGCGGAAEPEESADAGVEAAPADDAASCDLGADGLRAVCDCTTRMYVASVSDACRYGDDRYLCNQVCPP